MRYLRLLCIFVVSTHLMYGQELAPMPQPPECPVTPVASFNDPQTSSSYRLLAHFIAALSEGNETVRRALKNNQTSFSKSESPEQRMSDIFLNFDES